jgi:hypothetical protein
MLKNIHEFLYKYIMETCGMIWNEFNEDRILKNIH